VTAAEYTRGVLDVIDNLGVITPAMVKGVC